MFTNSRSIDDRATAASFDTAYQKYASTGDAWFDGTPASVDARLANCRRLTHIARTRVARRGADAGPLTNLAALEADARALTELRRDLLTGAYDREDNSPIAGVHVASPGDKHVNEMDDDERHDWAQWCKDHGMDKKKQARHDGDEDEYDEEAYVDDDDDMQEWGKVWKRGPGGKDLEKRLDNDYLFDEKGRYHRDRFREAGDHRLDEFAGSGRPAINPYTGDDDGEFKGNPQGHGHWGKESSLSPQDRRYVTLESSKFLADNTDTNDARELATRAMHHAQLVTSSYDVKRSRAITSAFVEKVAWGAQQRHHYIQDAILPLMQGVSHGLEGVDGGHPHGGLHAFEQGLGEGFRQGIPESDESFPEPPAGATWRDIAQPLAQGIGKELGKPRHAAVNNIPPEALFL